MSIFERNESFKGFLKQYPITSIMIGINLIIMLLMSVDGGSTNQYTLLKYGAYYEPLILEGDWYRLFTPMFLHIGWEHFFFNTFSLIIFAAGLEKLIGSTRYFFVYILSGLGGSVFTLFASAHVLSAGASGAIFGVFGAFLAILLTKKYPLDPSTKQIFLVIFVINMISTFVLSNISITGHIGGLITGFIVTVILTIKK